MGGITKTVLRGVGICLLLSLCLMQPGNAAYSRMPNEFAEWDGTLRRLRVPILMYHYISPLPPGADEVRTELTVLPHIFEAHLQYLREQGYETVSLYDVHMALMRGSSLPPRPIVLTFDDGYSDHYDTVFPLLNAYGYTATFFIISSRPDVNAPGYMSWSQIGEMAAAGMSMQSHTKDHPDLRNRDADFLIYQIMGSIESIIAHTGQSVNIFAYPVGRYDENTLNVLGTMDVWRAVTTQNGSIHTTDNFLEVSRLRVSGNMGVPGLAQLLALPR